MNNAELIVQTLERAGVKWAFGVPSGPALPLIEALRRSKVEYVLTASETSAGFMAQTVGALTGIPGVCISTLGPGATNLATGVGAAWLDRSPVIAITCNVDTSMLKRRTQMRIDHHKLFEPLTKASIALQAGEVLESLTSAIWLATREPPGPVHLDLPEDVALAPAVNSPVTPGPTLPLKPIPADVFAEVSELLGKSDRPLLVIGLELGRTRLYRRLLDFVETQNIPFITTLHGKGFLPESHANYAGVLGRARRSDVARFMAGADLIIAVGYDPIEINYEEWAGTTPVIHIGTELAEESAGFNLVLNASGHLDAAIAELAALPRSKNAWSAAEFAQHQRNLDAALRPETDGLGPHHVLDMLQQRLPEHGILAYDVGAHTHQIATQWRTDEPFTCISTNGWSSMGYGIPSAYAARLVHPDRGVVAVVGDGCFAMTAGELTVGRRLNLAVPVVVLNDGWLSLIKVKQDRRGFENSGVRVGEPPPSPAHYFGVPVKGARTPQEMAQALDWAFAQDGPTVVEAFIDAAPYAQTVYD
jgi:acetolactate synthase I/II/III large subunit